ncbi:RHS repeat domain-containing protein, partial [Ramlibacter sp.]|uniref:RHS repeat domain-containing protein n=1 Tax=Ramlibacter sp. TaxID=1917967 RepID=UPI0035AFEE56
SIHPDHLGTPRVMKNEQNEVVWQWPYSGFGNNKPTGVLKATPNPNAAITNQPVLLKATNPTELNLRFPGQYAEDAGGVVYNYFRNYDPRVGRYTQADPIGLAGGINRYVYAEQNSASISDPFGLNPIEVFGKPQVTRTLGHDIASMTIGDAATICKKVSEIHYNRSLAAITGDVSAGKLRPDVVLVYPNGKMRLYEVPSSSQTVEQMNSKMSAMMKSLKSLGIDCTCETVTVDSAKQGKFTVRALGLLNMLSLTGGIADLYRAQSADPNLTTIEGLYILNGTPLPKRELD